MKFNLKDKKTKVFMSISLFYIVSLCFTIYLYSNVSSKNIELNNNLNRITQKLNKQIVENKNLSNKNKLIVKNNINDDTKLNETINHNIKSLFTALYSFEEGEYSDRGAKAKQYISDNLYKELFPDLKSSGMYDKVSSNLKNVTVFEQIYYLNSTDNSKELLVEVEYESKYEKDESRIQKSIYQVKYDTNTNKIEHLNKVDVVNDSGEYK